MDTKVKGLLDDFGKYFTDYPSHDSIDALTFLPRFVAWHPGMTAEQLAANTAIIRTALEKDADADQYRNIVGDLAEHHMVTRLGNLLNEFHEGDLEDTLGSMTRITDDYKRQLGIKAASAYIDTKIGELLQDEFDDTGVSWRLGCLNDSMRRLRPGDFGIIGARPDKGKTSFIASETTCFAPQLPPDRNVLWLNNEGPGRRIIPRLYQAALNLTMDEMKVLHSQGRLEPMYEQFMGRLDKIRVVDIHGFNNNQVQTIIEDNNAGVIVYDMIDNIRGFGDAARTDLMLEQMYQWGRETSVKYDCIGLATSQVSNDGDGLMFPTMGMLKDSKTGKQGANDFMIMIGASNDPGLQGSRWIGVPKNKLRRPSGQSDPRAEVIFDAIRSRYIDIPIGA